MHFGAAAAEPSIAVFPFNVLSRRTLDESAVFSDSTTGMVTQTHAIMLQTNDAVGGKVSQHQESPAESSHDAAWPATVTPTGYYEEDQDAGHSCGDDGVLEFGMDRAWIGNS